MSNIYYFFFYSVAMFVKKINKNDSDYAFSSVVFISSCMICNVLSIVLLINKYQSAGLNPTLTSILIGLPLIALNWYLLMSNAKADTIVALYDEKYQNKSYSPLSLFFVILYIVFSYGSCIFIAYLLRNHLL